MVDLANAENVGWLKRSGFKFYTGPYKPRLVAPPGARLVSGVDLARKLQINGWPMLLPDGVGPTLFFQDLFAIDFAPDTGWLLPLWAHLYSFDAGARTEGMAYGTTVARISAGPLTGMTFLGPACGRGGAGRGRGPLSPCVAGRAGVGEPGSVAGRAASAAAVRTVAGA